jgi:amino acid transporter
MTYFSLAITVMLSIFKGFDAFMPWDLNTFITHYIGIPVFVVGYFGFKSEQ